MTLHELIHEYITVHVSKLKSAVLIERSLTRYCVGLADRPVVEITKRDIAVWHADIGKQYTQAANAVLKQLSACFEYAIDEEYLVKNPCRGVRTFAAQARKRFVQPHEMERLTVALRDADLAGRVFITMILLTAARRDEVRLCEWAHLDLDNKRWIKPTTKTTTHTTSLPDDVVEDLRQLKRTSKYVFATRTGKPWNQAWVHVVWREIRSAAGLNDVHIHDLRRTTATYLDQRGVSLPTIQKVLNHTNIQTTQRYLVGLSVNDAVVDALNENARLIGR